MELDEDLQARVDARTRASVEAVAEDVDKRLSRSFPALTQYRAKDLVSYVNSVMTKACAKSDDQERTFYDNLHIRYGGQGIEWKHLKA